MVLSDHCALYSYRPLHTVLTRCVGMENGNKQIRYVPRVYFLYYRGKRTLFTLCYSASSVQANAIFIARFCENPTTAERF